MNADDAQRRHEHEPHRQVAGERRQREGRPPPPHEVERVRAEPHDGLGNPAKRRTPREPERTSAQPLRKLTDPAGAGLAAEGHRERREHEDEGDAADRRRQLQQGVPLPFG